MDRCESLDKYHFPYYSMAFPPLQILQISRFALWKKGYFHTFTKNTFQGVFNTNPLRWIFPYIQFQMFSTQQHTMLLYLKVSCYIKHDV